MARALGLGGIDYRLGDTRVSNPDPKNVVEVVVEVRVTPGRPGVRWEVTAGDLAPGLGSAEYAVFDVANSEAKTAQGPAVQGPSVLMVDVSRRCGVDAPGTRLGPDAGPALPPSLPVRCGRGLPPESGTSVPTGRGGRHLLADQ